MRKRLRLVWFLYSPRRSVGTRRSAETRTVPTRLRGDTAASGEEPLGGRRGPAEAGESVPVSSGTGIH
ncbi:hypothetical protein [Streptomyces sp. GS7]|uniref:hypothetical protein n=1 Tax=Streptomyces sp. GS7 TaxID=2692234 RepID=UPI001318BEA7|nr:hypothetical protein [Streptomyces sp. GS7]QHC21752.1 hypothetical protein GR130_10270 [Streptomyces sp. GS7]